MKQDTIYALSSGAVPAAIAIVRLSGPLAEEAAEKLAGKLPEPRYASLRRLFAKDGGLIDEALLLRFSAPHTVTGEALVEFHLHGGRAIVARLFAELASMPGLREAESGEFTRRALLNGRLDLTQAEGLADLLSAETEWQRRAAVASAGGEVRREVEGWRDRLINLSAQAEAAIDYVGDEEETSIDLGLLVEEVTLLAGELETRLRFPPAELLQEGLRVVLAGPPNSGKSSLFNALVGEEKAIVTSVPGTTRDLIEARIDLGEIPITLVDTAGLRESSDQVERIGVARAERALEEADILLWLGDPEKAPSSNHRILVHSREDERPCLPQGSVPTSVRKPNGIVELSGVLREMAASLLPPEDRSALNRRQLSALADAAASLKSAGTGDLLIIAEALRQSLVALDRLTGTSSTEEVLDALFRRFCLGK